VRVKRRPDLKVLPQLADTGRVERPTPDRLLVGLEATRDGAVLSWDVPMAIIDGVRTHLEAEGWEVVVNIGDGPRRRKRPRIERRKP
jgi:hypothetical protein